MDTLVESPIREFFANKSVLVTGATGFIGKVRYFFKSNSIKLKISNYYSNQFVF